MAERRYVILAEGSFGDEFAAKTARGVLRYSRDEIVAVVDSTLAGRNTTDIVSGLARAVPVIADVRDALILAPTSLLLGTASIGGSMPASFRTQVLIGIDAGLEIVNGLHDLLAEDREFVERAAQSGAKLWDVREPQVPSHVFTGKAYDAPQFIVLAVGTDCAVGKMSVMLELEASGKNDALRPEFVATGQTGIMIAGKGIAVDRVISDYVCGAAEQLVLDVSSDVDVALVEGQGAILHPAFAPVTFGLLYGCAPDALILCHRANQKTIVQYGSRIPPLTDIIALHEQILNRIKPAQCLAIALNTSHLSDEDARREIATTAEETGLPTDDVVRFGAGRLWEVVAGAARCGQKMTNVAS